MYKNETAISKRKFPVDIDTSIMEIKVFDVQVLMLQYISSMTLFTSGIAVVL